MDMLKDVPGSISETRVTDFIYCIVAAICIIAGVANWIINGIDIPTGVVTVISLVVGISKAGKVAQKFAEIKTQDTQNVEKTENNI